MGQTTASIPPKGYKSLQGSDFAKGIGTILFGSVTAIILFALGQDHFPNWVELRPFVLSGATTLFGYISKNYFTNNEGKMFKDDAPTTTVSTPALEAVIEKAADATK